MFDESPRGVVAEAGRVDVWHVRRDGPAPPTRCGRQRSVYGPRLPGLFAWRHEAAIAERVVPGRDLRVSETYYGRMPLNTRLGDVLLGYGGLRYCGRASRISAGTYL
jgi:hypothetical protein